MNGDLAYIKDADILSQIEQIITNDSDDIEYLDIEEK
jgi:hypothetical protein